MPTCKPTPLHTRKFYQTRSRNYKRRAKGATVFGNERGNIVTRGETASFAEDESHVLTVCWYMHMQNEERRKRNDLKWKSFYGGNIELLRRQFISRRSSTYIEKKERSWKNVAEMLQCCMKSMFYQCCIYINSSTLIINAATILNKIEPQVEFLLIFSHWLLMLLQLKRHWINYISKSIL